MESKVKAICISKVKNLSSRERHFAEKAGLKPDDLVIVQLEKIEGSPTEYLLKRFLGEGFITEEEKEEIMLMGETIGNRKGPHG